MMSIYTVDWNSLLSSTSILPPDISLKIISEDGKEKVVVKAHRLVLSLLSPVFRTYLSEGGSWHKAGAEVIIKDVSPTSFQTMLNFFYAKDFNISEEFKTFEDVFEILKVADRYQVEVLINLCKKTLRNFPMQLDSVVNIINTANYYKNLEPFAKISEEIIERARDFLTKELKTTSDVLLFLAQSDTDNSILEDSIKLEILKSMANRKFKNCGVALINKFHVTRENMVVGDKVEVSERSLFKYDSKSMLEVGHQGKIKRYDDTEYTIEWDAYGELTYDVSRDFHVPMKFICGCAAN